MWPLCLSGSPATAPPVPAGTSLHQTASGAAGSARVTSPVHQGRRNPPPPTESESAGPGPRSKAKAGGRSRQTAIEPPAARLIEPPAARLHVSSRSQSRHLEIRCAASRADELSGDAREPPAGGGPPAAASSCQQPLGLRYWGLKVIEV